MQINKIALDGDLDLFGGRALVIQTDTGSFKTPSRALTSSEFNYKAEIPFRPPLDGDVSEIVAIFDQEYWIKFMTTKGSFNSRLGTLDSFGYKMKHSIVRRYYPQLTQDINLTKEGIKQLLDLQNYCDALDFITLPNLPATYNNYDKTVDGFTKEVLDNNREPLIYLDMRLDVNTFKERFLNILELSQSDQVHAVGLTYHSVRENYPNYRLLWEHRGDAEIFMQMSQVPRELAGTSIMHMLQKFGIDSFGVEVRKPFFVGGNKEHKSNPSEKMKRFDPTPLLFKRFREWADHDSDLNCSCPICKNKSAEEFIEIYSGEYETYEGQTLQAANRLHECYRSLDEFAISRDYIRRGELKHYFNIKPGLKASDIPISKNLFNFK